jgi:hypothetical protein
MQENVDDFFQTQKNKNIAKKTGACIM